MHKNFLLTISLFPTFLLAEIQQEINGDQQEKLLIREFTPIPFYPSVLDKTMICPPADNIKYWFIGALEVGATYIQNSQQAKGVDLSSAIGSRFNFSKMQARPYTDVGHSLALKIGIDYFRFLTTPQYGNLMFLAGIDYSYVSSSRMGISVGFTTYISLLSRLDSHLTTGLALSYDGIFVRGEYVILPFMTNSKITNTLKITLGYKI